MGLDNAYQEAMAQPVKVHGKLYVGIRPKVLLLILFFWLKANETLTISWWWMLLALLA